MTETWALVKELGSTGSVIAVVIYFMKYIRERDKDARSQQESINTLLGNHLQHTSESNEKAAHIMASALERLSADCDRRNHK